MDFAK